MFVCLLLMRHGKLKIRNSKGVCWYVYAVCYDSRSILWSSWWANLESAVGQVSLCRLTKCCLMPGVVAELVAERSSAVRRSVADASSGLLALLL